MVAAPKHATAILTLQLAVALLQVLVFSPAGADYIPPAKQDGFLYQNRSFSFDSVLIEAFFDPLCPDSADSWPPLKQALDEHASRVAFVVHLLPLPYHDNAYVASRALHVVNALNSSATFPLLEWFFKYQEKFYGAQTRNLSRAHIQKEIVKSATEIIGKPYYHSVKNGFNDSKSDLQTRISFKYAASRGVYGTPFFYVNGFLLPDVGNAIDYKTWKKTIDSLIGAEKNVKNEESLHFFL